MLILNIFSGLFYIYYGETKIAATFQNSAVSGHMCGVSVISENESFFQVFQIVVLTFYTIEFLVLIVMQKCILLKICYFNSRYQYKKVAHKKMENKTRNTVTTEVYADKDFSVINSDTLICSSCVEFKNKTKCETGEKAMKSACQIMSDIEISNSENVILCDETPKKAKYSRKKNLN